MSLESEELYNAGQYGYQEAKKSVEFKSLPNIIFFQLMRFQFDLQTKRNEKINDRFEFFENIDLTDFFVLENSKKKQKVSKKQSNTSSKLFWCIVGLLKVVTTLYLLIQN